MESFVQETSIAQKLTWAIAAVVLLFLIEFGSFYISGRGLLRGLSNLHEAEQLSSSIIVLGQITDTLADSVAKLGSGPESMRDTRHVFREVYAQADSQLKRIGDLTRGNSEFSGYFQQMTEAFRQLDVSAEQSFSGGSAPEREREIALTRQFGLDATEAQDRLRFAVEKYSNQIFEGVYRERYLPLSVAVFLTLLFISLSLVGGLAFVRNFSESVVTLVKAISEVALGNLELQVPILQHDEFGTLTHSFNVMASALHRSTVSKNYVETIIQSLPDLLLVLTADGRTERVNPVTLRVLGESDSSIQGITLTKYLGGAQGAFEGKLQELKKGVPVQNWETTLRTTGGREIPVLLSASAVRGKDETISGYVCIFKDITERREADLERKIAADSQRILAEATSVFSESINYSLTLKHVLQALVPRLGEWGLIRILDKDRKIQLVEFFSSSIDLEPTIREVISGFGLDPSCHPIFGSPHHFERTQVISMFTEDSILPLSHEQLVLVRKLKVQSTLESPLLYGGRVLGSVTIVSSDPKHRFTSRDLILFEELARRAAIALENARLYDEAQTAISARDEFLSIASHELRTPLTALSLQLQVLQRGLMKSLNEKNAPERSSDWVFIPRKTATLVSACEEQSKKLTGLLEELLDLTRIRIGRLQLNKQAVDLREIVLETAERFRAEAAQNGVLISIEAHHPTIGNWDALRIEQVVSNLISNAIKYGNRKSITVRVEVDHARCLARLIVKDQGSGIAPEMKDKIFERFERAGLTGKKISGLGLGLYIARQIIEGHSGSIYVKSEQGQGAEFVVELPL